MRVQPQLFYLLEEENPVGPGSHGGPSPEHRFKPGLTSLGALCFIPTTLQARF